MTVVRDGNRITDGHYFCQKFLKDIPISGSAKRSLIVLTEPSGGIFHLHFVGNGGEGPRPLDFENSIGMEGTWVKSDGTRTYPVSLRGTTIHEGSWDRHRYRDVTKQDDVAFERRVQSLLRAVLHGDKKNAVRFISYPMLVNFPNQATRKFRTPAGLLAAWNDVFTPVLMAKLQRALPHDMFVHNGMAMIGSGEAWFDDKGLATLNIPPAPEVRVH